MLHCAQSDGSITFPSPLSLKSKEFCSFVAPELSILLLLLLID